jgi:hypothetical protein
MIEQNYLSAGRTRRTQQLFEKWAENLMKMWLRGRDLNPVTIFRQPSRSCNYAKSFNSAKSQGGLGLPIFHHLSWNIREMIPQRWVTTKQTGHPPGAPDPGANRTTHGIIAFRNRVKRRRRNGRNVIDRRLASGQNAVAMRDPLIEERGGPDARRSDTRSSWRLTWFWLPQLSVSGRSWFFISLERSSES